MEQHGGANICTTGGPCARAGGCALKEAAGCEDKPTQEQAPGRSHSMWGTMAQEFVPEGLDSVENPKL